MSIEEIDIPELDNKPPSFRRILYPVPYQKHIQSPYYIAIFLGSRGSGKSYGLVRMLLNQEKSGFYDPITKDKVKIRHILFSPTAQSNPIFTALKYLDEDDIINDYTDEKLIEIIEEVKEHNKKVKEYRAYVEAYKRYEKMSEAELRRCTDWDFLGLLMAYDYQDYREMEKPDQTVVNIILDDCLANREAFSAKKANTLTRAVINGRHIGINILIASQHIGAIPLIIRQQVEIWMIFKCKNEKVLMENIYPEISSLYTPEEFLTYYNYVISGSDHDALVYDGKEPDKKDRMKLNFDVILRLK